MYNIPYFKAKDSESVIAFMQANPFIVLCGVDKNGQPVATHIPVLIEQRGEQLFLLAHIMRKQNHTVAFETNPQVLAIFSAAHSYVSANWYETKNTAGTWNYQAVHANGVIRFLDDNALFDLLTKLTDYFEGNNHSPAAVKNMSADYLTNMMKAIVAFEIEVTNIEHVFKLSQNKDAKSYENIIQQLQQGDNNQKEVAKAMQAKSI